MKSKKVQNKKFKLAIFILLLLTGVINPISALGIGNCLQLQNMSNGLGSSYILINDINCTNTFTWNGGDGFNPVGDSASPFSGTFDGNGYTISNLFINRTNENEVGLFGYLSATTKITNVKLENVSIKGNRSVGALLGGDVGGGIISFSYSTGTVTGYRAVGGLVGGEDSGGDAASLITNSYSNVTVTGTGNNYHGGLVGLMISGDIINSYATGNVSGNLGVGGLAGSWGYDIINSYSTGNVSGAGTTGGLVADGLAWTPNVTNSFWDMNTSNQATSTGGTGKNTTEMKNVTIFTDVSTSGLNTSWDFINNPNNDSLGHDYWRINSSINNGYPRLRGPQTFQGGNGNTSNPYQISTCWELQEISETFSHLLDNYILINDVNCSNTTNWNSGAGFIPIRGRGLEHFSGTLNGDSYIINNLVINDAVSSYVGIFYLISSSLVNITNVNLEDVNITGTNYVGGIIGSNFGGAIINSYFDGSATSTGYHAGGITGSNQYIGTNPCSYQPYKSSNIICSSNVYIF